MERQRMSDPFDAIEKVDGIAIPIDPYDLLHCESCE
jgi:hypothetical protein